MIFLIFAYIGSEEQVIKYEEMFTEFSKQMMTVAQRYLNREDAEDVVLTVFETIGRKNWDKVCSLKSKNDLRNYLLKATKNTALNKLNHKSRSNISLEYATENEFDDTVDLTDESFFASLEKVSDYRATVAAIEGLKPIYRNVLTLRFLEGYSVEKISRELRQNKETTKKQISRGKKILLGALNA